MQENYCGGGGGGLLSLHIRIGGGEHLAVDRTGKERRGICPRKERREAKSWLPLPPLPVPSFPGDAMIHPAAAATHSHAHGVAVHVPRRRVRTERPLGIVRVTLPGPTPASQGERGPAGGSCTQHGHGATGQKRKEAFSPFL